MKKCLQKIVLLALMVVAALWIGKVDAKAATIVEEGSCGENATYTLDSDGVLTISGSGAINDYAFTGLEWARDEKVRYEKVEKIKKVVIGKGITKIGEMAFGGGCNSLTSITIPEGVTEIGKYAFSCCSNLTCITIPESVTKISEMAFGYCLSLASITIPKGVTKIGEMAFVHCPSLASITISEGTTEIGDNAFWNVNKNCIIYGYIGSTAETYATENNIAFKTINSADTASKTKLTAKNTTIKLSKTSYIYSGKAKRPTVKVLTSAGKVIKASNYTVQYSNNVKVGRATAIIKFKGKYSGKIKATYTIKPKTTAIKTVAKKSNGVMVTWKKQSKQVSGYQIQYATDKKFTKDKKTVLVKGTSKTAKTITGMNKNKAYYIRIRTYKTVNGKKYYSSWSKVKSYNDNPFAESYKSILKQYPEDKKVVVKVNGKDVDLTDYTKYTLYDVDTDGTPELLIKKGDEIDIYTYDGQTAKKCGQIEDSFYSIYGNSENGIIVYGGGSGSLHMEYIDLYTLKNGRIYGPSTIMNTEEHSYEEIRNKVSSFTEITNFHRLSDTFLLDN